MNNKSKPKQNIQSNRDFKQSNKNIFGNNNKK